MRKDSMQLLRDRSGAPRLLLTGFEPFAKFTSNPSEHVARALAGPEVHAAILPVDFRAVRPALEELLARPWDAVLLLGLSAARSRLSLERVAINHREGEDRNGRTPDRPEVVPDGPAAYFSTLPLDDLCAAVAAAGLPVEISSSAGAYVCNAAFYLARHGLEQSGTPCGFIHVPRTPDLDGPGESMSLEDQVRGVGIVVESLLSASGPAKLDS